MSQGFHVPAPSVNLKKASKTMRQTKIDEELPPLQGEQLEAFNEIVNNQQRNFFIQGQAGTGKSTLINHLKIELERQGRNVALVAPTGIAAELIGGCTIHSLFRLGIKLRHEEEYEFFDPVVSALDAIIIDEVSMLRADLFDVVNQICQTAKKNEACFGGIQMILVGDLHQLSPIYKDNEQEYIEAHYNTKQPYFFDAKCYAEGNFEMRVLEKVYRQSTDQEFLKNLQALCTADRTTIREAIDTFNRRVGELPDDEFVPIITPYKNLANRENQIALDNINGKSVEYIADIEGDFTPEQDALAPEKLVLKVGARVMFCRNDKKPTKYYNGTFGIITKLQTLPYEMIEVKTERGDLVELCERTTWEKKSYAVSENQPETIEQITIGTFRQFPLMLAYAITIHKAQGQTWDKEVISTDYRPFFAHGQLYVALSRVKRLGGIYLNRKLTFADVHFDQRIRQFLGTGTIPSTAAQQANKISENNRKDIDFMKKLWEDYCDGDAKIVYSKLSTPRRKGTKRYLPYSPCFWSTMPFSYLDANINFIFNDVDNYTSYLFKIPANSINSSQVSAKRDVDTLKSLKWDSTTGRMLDRYNDWEDYRSAFFDLFVKPSDDFEEQHKKSVYFKEYLVAIETDGVITICRTSQEDS